MAILHIVRASAGSGKTFRLTLEYLSYLFEDTENFKHILAVTFTNKATEEMKSRIIGVLHELALGGPSKYLNPLIEKTGKTEKEIRLKSGIILKKILHNYSRFSVSTIDSFFQSIIRSFTREIGIQRSYILEMDDGLVLHKAIDDIFLRVGHDAVLRDWLVEFAKSRIEEARSWNLKGKIYDLGMEIFKEKYKQFSDSIINKLQDKTFLTSFKNELFKITKSFEVVLQDYGKQAMQVIRQNNLRVDDFYYKSKGPAGYFQKLEDGIIPVISTYITTVLEDIDKWAKQDNANWPVISRICESALHPMLQITVNYFQENKARYFTAQTLLKNFYTLGILTDITSSVYAHTRNKNLFLISDSAQFINRIIDNNDTPFIYEKTGNYFHHFLIDEFQDTSGFQWKNFKPLISNSLSQDFNCLIVGDVKQSIYRWRNSNWEILSKEILSDFYAGAIHTETLDINRRSKKNIVEFNNLFFTRAAEILQSQLNSELSEDEDNDAITSLYKDIIQKLPEESPEGGYVDVQLTTSDESDNEFIFTRVVEIIKELQDKGCSLSDIAILTRNKKEGKEMAEYLLEYMQNLEPDSGYKFDVVSEESLFVGSSLAIKFILSVYRHMVDPDDDINNYFLLFEYLNFIQNSAGDKNTAAVPQYTPATRDRNFKEILPAEFIKMVEFQSDYSLYETLQKIIRIFQLHVIQGEQAYIQAFKDMVIDFTEHNSSSIPAFLEYWEETGFQKAIQGAENQEAIRILTIHKSKGLEFKVVIMPFCNWKINYPGSVIWCNTGQSPFNLLDILPVEFNVSLKETYFAKDYFDEKLKTYIDNLNLLYVAFTRAKEGLYCIVPADERKNQNEIKTIAHLVIRTLNQKDLNTEQKKEALMEKIVIFESGKPEFSETEKDISAQRISMLDMPEYNTIQRMRIAFHAKEYLASEDNEFQPLSYGRIMHELFSQIFTLKDISTATESLYYQGKISKTEMEIIRKDVTALFSDIQVSSWFSGEWKVLNERDILVGSQSNKRPDRVLIKDKSAIVIDFKFGEKELKEHHRQVAEYGELIRQMGFEKVETYLWYITRNKILQVI